MCGLLQYVDLYLCRVASKFDIRKVKIVKWQYFHIGNEYWNMIEVLERPKKECFLDIVCVMANISQELHQYIAVVL
jgi:hypothetical protein